MRDTGDTSLDQLKKEVKEVIIKTLNITRLKPEDVDDSAPLFAPDNPFGLDSVDAIDIVMTVQKNFNVRIDDQNTARDVLESVNSLAEFIYRKRNQ